MTKYNNKFTTVDNIEFHSKKEAYRYIELKAMLRAREISELELQPKYEFKLNGIKICTYSADFKYKDKQGNEIVEDVKSLPTSKKSDYRIKNKMMKAFYGIDIFEYGIVKKRKKKD